MDIYAGGFDSVFCKSDKENAVNKKNKLVWV